MTKPRHTYQYVLEQWHTRCAFPVSQDSTSPTSATTAASDVSSKISDCPDSSATGRLVTEEHPDPGTCAHPVHPLRQGRTGPHRRSRFRRSELERHRDRLDLRRPRHVKKCKVRITEGAIPPVQASTAARFRRNSSRTGGALRAWPVRPVTSSSTFLPLTTRPKASTFGVGLRGHHCFGRKCQKRFL